MSTNRLSLSCLQTFWVQILEWHLELKPFFNLNFKVFSIQQHQFDTYQQKNLFVLFLNWYHNSLNFTRVQWILNITFLNSSVSSTWPRTCLTRAWRMSKQWILLPRAIGRLKLTKATTFGLGMPRGGSRLAIKSASWPNLMNWVAWGSNLKQVNIGLINNSLCSLACPF